MIDREKAIILLTQVYGYCSFIRATGLIMRDKEKMTMWFNLLKLCGVKLTLKEKDEIYQEVFENIGNFEKSAEWAHKHKIDMFKEFN